MRIGITGGIGSGKSTITRELEKLGVPVYYSDIKAKGLMVTDKNLIKSITDLLGEESYHSNGSLNIHYLTGRLFTDKLLMDKINNLVHPVVMEDFNKWCDVQESPYSLIESAILVETGLYKKLDGLITVSTNTETRIKRVMERNLLTKEEVEIKMKDQLSDNDREQVADIIIENNGGMEDVKLLAKELKSKLDKWV